MGRRVRKVSALPCSVLSAAGPGMLITRKGSRAAVPCWPSQLVHPCASVCKPTAATSMLRSCGQPALDAAAAAAATQHPARDHPEPVVAPAATPKAGGGNPRWRPKPPAAAAASAIRAPTWAAVARRPARVPWARLEGAGWQRCDQKQRQRRGGQQRRHGSKATAGRARHAACRGLRRVARWRGCGCGSGEGEWDRLSALLAAALRRKKGAGVGLFTPGPCEFKLSPTFSLPSARLQAVQALKRDRAAGCL